MVISDNTTGTTARIEYPYGGEICNSGVFKRGMAEKQLSAYKAVYGEDCRIVLTDEQY